MKTLVLALTAAGAVFATQAFAESKPAAPPEKVASAEAPLGRDGQNTSDHCSAQNRTMEYRDCVNASTRDPNAKVRMG